MEELEEAFPLCKNHNEELYRDVLHHYKVMLEVSTRMNIPVEELMDFFYKGKLKMEFIKEQEEVLKRCQL